ncbi:Na(+)-translocating NADH-quinone reductase subunit E [Psychromonas sp. psych-6C06]|uniref:(Na+)-NQR maturation NqrM n=1 Tax=Psychromonas sp. psych-6C06 TaxID=2058089 RepID=UPI000C34FD20|nr:(Na+)-NQR maturation NqrM [Psychromonas sp. psych-6C06]PKF62744.1 Na(+)-translocating NADH-quinone reductase subunit E [Psychromonas sp. psych-6C06]
MIYFIATFVVFLVVIVAMAIGYIVNKKTIGGSCGGLASVGIDKECDCPEPCDNRKKKNAEAERIAKLKSAEQIL